MNAGHGVLPVATMHRPDDGGRMRTPQLLPHLAQALRAQAMHLAYQPQVDAGTGRLLGFEALMRWTDPKLGVVSPAEFVPVAEAHDLIDELWSCLLNALAHERHRLSASPELHYALNVSARQLPIDGLAQRFGEWMAEQQIDGSQVHIEITETALISGGMIRDRNLNRFRELGVQVWLDDFGTGYSSLRHLRDLPISGLKLDRSFVKELDENLADFRIVSAVIAMANSLGLRVVAEGVETPEQAEILGQLGCNVLQGYLIGRPAPLCELHSRWLSTPTGKPS